MLDKLLDKLDLVTDRAAYVTAGVFLVLSVAAALATPMESMLGRWVQLVIWHGMLKWAVIVWILGMGLVALAYLAKPEGRLYEWAHAMQIATLPIWCFAVFIGAGAARLVWGSWNLAERRMTMSVIYIMVAAAVLVVGVFFDKPRLNSVLAVLTSLTMGALLIWIALGPAENDVHPASAVMSSDSGAFKSAAAAMLVTCLVWVLALVVPVRHWVRRHAHTQEEGEPVG